MRISDWSSDVCSSDLFQGDKPDVRDVIERCDEASQLGFVVDNLDNEGTAILENAALVDVCRSAEPQPGFKNRDACQARVPRAGSNDLKYPAIDRKSVVEGKSVAVRVSLGGGRTIKKKKRTIIHNIRK